MSLCLFKIYKFLLIYFQQFKGIAMGFQFRTGQKHGPQLHIRIPKKHISSLQGKNRSVNTITHNATQGNMIYAMPSSWFCIKDTTITMTRENIYFLQLWISTNMLIQDMKITQHPHTINLKDSLNLPSDISQGMLQ